MGTKVRENDLGHLEGINEETGEVEWIESKKTPPTPKVHHRASGPGRGRPRKKDQETHHWVLGPDGKKLWLPKGTDPSKLPKTVWPYNKVTADQICMLTMQGKTIKEIGMTEGMPTHDVIWNWMKDYVEFKQAMKKARELRAWYMEDQALEIAANTRKATVPQDRLKFDIYKWGAAVNDPETYGNRVKHSGDKDQPIAFLIDTGIRRENDPGTSASPELLSPPEGDGTS